MDAAAKATNFYKTLFFLLKLRFYDFYGFLRRNESTCDGKEKLVSRTLI
jgi:hypothetical protein